MPIMRGSVLAYLDLVAFGCLAAMTLSHSTIKAQEIQGESDTYSGRTAKNYSYRFGSSQPFLPSNIQTIGGRFIDANAFPTARYCGHCHQEAHAEWRQSAHSNSNRAPWYLKNVGLLNTEGVEFSRHCEGCHDPIAVVAGALTSGAPSKRPYDQDGVTCMVCHSIQKVDTRGTGSFTLGVPAALLDEKGLLIPNRAVGRVILTATVKYRRFDQHFIDFGMIKGYEQPVVEMASATRTLMLGANDPTPPTASENKEWMR